MGFRPTALFTGGCLLGATGGVLLAAGQAEAAASPGLSDQAWLVPLVGAAFLTAGLLSRTTTGTRALVAAVGLTWLLPSFVPSTVVLHQGLLLITLVAFPSGTLRRQNMLVLAAAGLVAFGALPRPAVAAAFALASLWAGTRTPRTPSTWAVCFAGTTLAVTIAGLFLLPRESATYNPHVGLLTYELVLLGVATMLAASTYVRETRTAALTDQLLSDTRVSGLAGLRAVLADLLRDPDLRIELVDCRPQGALPDQADASAAGSGMMVLEGDRPVAVLRHHTRALRDAPTAEAVREVVRLMVRKDERQTELDRRVIELQGARQRVAKATDEERASAAALLRDDVVVPLIGTAALLRDLAAEVGNADARTAMFVAAGEIATAIRDIERLVVGVTPEPLGEGQLGPALRALGARMTIPTRVDVDATSPASQSVESALFYVASEALTNANKHSHAASIGITLHTRSDCLALTVCDDGKGGADPNGSGLRGLRDRVHSVGGELSVVSPPGAGTVVTATVPIC
jgi:signal transduction histidine kinase